MSDDGLIAVVLSTLRKAGWWCARLQSGTAHGGRMKLAPAGSPDVVAIRAYTGRGYLIECKARQGKIRRAQEELKRWADDSGVEYVVVRSSADVATLVGKE